jgi:hypothetical protein
VEAQTKKAPALAHRGFASEDHPPHFLVSIESAVGESQCDEASIRTYQVVNLVPA